MMLVVVSLILSWASLGAGTATAVVRNYLNCRLYEFFFLSHICFLFIYISFFQLTISHAQMSCWTVVVLAFYSQGYYCQ